MDGVMNRGLIKKILINLSLIMLNIAVFSDAFIGVNLLSGDIVGIVIGTAVILLTLFIFIMVNCIGFLGKPGAKSQDITSLKQCKTALSAYLRKIDVDRFRDSIYAIISRIEKFESKKDSVKKALSDSFDSTEITYAKFNTTVDTVEAVIIGNVGILINRLKVFGEGALYSEFADCMDSIITNCDDILIKMDRLLYELSVLSIQNEEELAKNSAVSELQKLIDSVKWYK